MKMKSIIIVTQEEAMARYNLHLRVLILPAKYNLSDV